MTNLAPDLLAEPQPERFAKTITDRLSQELIIALVGPVGSGVSTTANYLQEILVADFGYRASPIIKPSEIIGDEAHRVSLIKPPKQPLDVYITQMQTAGNQLRQRFGGDYLAEKAIERICKFRRECGGYSQEGHQIPGRRAYIIDSLKNLEELSLLKQVYGETLCVFGVFAPDEIRKRRLKDSGIEEDKINRIVDRDQHEIETFGQNTRKLFLEADFFLCNDRKPDELRARVARFLDIIFCTNIHTPTSSESAMYKASAASANSACMSRQVGAAIVSERGELIAVGWNDVPRFGGGLYCEDDQSLLDAEKSAIVDKDHRCFKWGGCICHNDQRRSGILDGIAKRLAKAGILKKGNSAANVRELLQGTEVDSLIEYSRSIHAEMEAILSVAREGKHSLINATLYTTTYPCHNCARHIVASGISSVIYIEPYKKSLAIALHSDSVSEDPNDKSKVVFRQYDGVAPRHYLRLFCPSAERKKGGEVLRPPKKSAPPMFRVPLDSFTDYEAKVVADLSRKEQNAEG